MQKIFHNYKNSNKLFDYIDALYYETSDTNKPVELTRSLIQTRFPSIFKGTLDLFEQYGYIFDIPLASISFSKMTDVELRKDADKCVIVCISGGKDSTATVLTLLDQGYTVFLYHMLNINKCYPDEYKRVQDIADYFHIPVFFDEVKVSGNHIYIEHPLKNYILVNGAIHYGLSLGVLNIALGDFENASLDNNAFEVSGGDCKELWTEYRTIISTILPQFNLMLPLDSGNDSLAAFIKNKELLALTQSCMGTFRFRDYKRKTNMEKYHIDILPHRCGSCWKCALEYIYYTDHDVLEFNEAYYKYCMNVLLREMKDNGLIPFTPEFIWYNFMGYDITQSKIYEDLKHAIVQSRQIKYNSKEIAREILSTSVLSN